MSRIAKAPVELPAGVTATIAADAVTIKGAKGSLSLPLTAGVSVVQTDKKLQIRFDAEGLARMRAGATRAHLANMVRGVTRGYEKKLELVGVGFRAQVQGKSLNLTLGFSHPVNVPIPEGINIETPSQTEIWVKGIDRQKVGQVAAEIRDIRPQISVWLDRKSTRLNSSHVKISYAVFCLKKKNKIKKNKEKAEHHKY